ncbi:MAG: ROK family protein [Tannerella sp.]|jgi:glucokinase|nr:ROK family protein [Tannerella sp.]
MSTFIGIDLGGTYIRAGRVVNDIIETQNQMHTPKNPKDEWETVDAIKEVIRTVINEQVEAIGIGVPSLVDRGKGIVYNVVNIPHWEEVPLKKALEKEYEVPVHLDNDANCFALAERHFGIGQDYQNFVGLTVGTGLGGGIIQQGRLLHDANCGSGEFGMLPYKDHILEYYASGSFFHNVYGMDGKEMFLKAQQNDPLALDAYRQLGVHLAAAVKMVMYTVDPEMIVFGGSVAEAHRLYEASLYENIQDFGYPNAVKKLRIFFSGIASPGILGAASLCY